MRRWFGALLALGAWAAWADEPVPVCYNYGCFSQELVIFPDSRLAWAGGLLGAAGTAQQEREYLSLVVGELYAVAAEQSPIGADRGGNIADEGEYGSMDCIDHSTTTTRFLRLLEGRSWLRFHYVGPIVDRRYLLLSRHYAASIEEKASGAMFAVDSWFVDNGEPAVILPLADWEEGGGPDV